MVTRENLTPAEEAAFARLDAWGSELARTLLEVWRVQAEACADMLERGGWTADECYAKRGPAGPQCYAPGLASHRREVLAIASTGEVVDDIGGRLWPTLRQALEELNRSKL